MTLELSRNQKMVHRLLEKSDKSMKAYRILFEIQEKGVKSPTQFSKICEKFDRKYSQHKLEIFGTCVACCEKT
jgi:Fe2+ or Zn2+ uptake regulation protein